MNSLVENELQKVVVSMVSGAVKSLSVAWVVVLFNKPKVCLFRSNLSIFNPTPAAQFNEKFGEVIHDIFGAKTVVSF